MELRLPAELTGHEAAFLNAADAIRSLAQVAIPRRQVEVMRDCQPDAWGEGRPDDGSRLIHTPETWCRIALLFAGASGLDASFLTLGRGMPERGLVELDRTANLRGPAGRLGRWGRRRPARTRCSSSTTASAGSCRSPQADLPSDPPSLAAAGIVPAPSTLQVLADGTCVVRRTGRALYRHWQLADAEAAARPLAAGARCTPRHGDHHRPGQRRAPRRT